MQQKHPGAQLRNHKVKFVSAGNTQMYESIMEEPEIAELRQQDTGCLLNNNLNTNNDICFTDSLGMRRGVSANDTIPPLHSSSPAPDSSEDEVVFPGRINCTNRLHRSFIERRDIEEAVKPYIYYQESSDPCALANVRTPEDFVYLPSRQHARRKEALLDEALMGVDYVETMDSDEESINELSERFLVTMANMNIDGSSPHRTPGDISYSDISLASEQVLSKNGKGIGSQHPKTKLWNTGGTLAMFGLRDEEIAELSDVTVPRNGEMESEQEIETTGLVHNARGLKQATASELNGRTRCSKRMERKNKARLKREFRATSTIADTLEQGSYSGFGITGFSRAISTKKSKGKSFIANFEVPDSELELEFLDLERVWDKDRSKKKKKKQQREELRSNGLLGQVTEKVDLNAKYPRGMTANDLKAEMKAFLLSSYASLHFPPMNKKNRKLVHNLANSVSLKSQSRGHGVSRFTIVYKTSRTSRYTDETISKVEQIFSRERPDNLPGPSFDQRNHKGRKAQRFRSNAAVSYTDGDVVGASAPEIGADNKGRAMLEKMGWSRGTALGSTNNKGILQPVEHVVKNSRTGLG